MNEPTKFSDGRETPPPESGWMLTWCAELKHFSHVVGATGTHVPDALAADHAENCWRRKQKTHIERVYVERDGYYHHWVSGTDWQTCDDQIHLWRKWGDAARKREEEGR